LENDPAELAKLRGDFEATAREIYRGNAIHMPFMMTRAIKV
jgi:hypothetical protein